MDQKDIYDKKSAYTVKIAPIIKQLKIACNLEKMPMFVTVAVANSPEGTDYKNDAIHASANIELKDDRIADVLLLLNGFETELPEYIKRDMRELQEYADRLRTLKEREHMDIELKDDKIQEFDRAVTAGEAIKAPDGMLEKAITDEFFDD